MPQGEYIRKPRKVICQECKEEFESTAFNVKWCPALHCQEARKKEQEARRTLYKKSYRRTYHKVSPIVQEVVKAKKTVRKCRYVLTRGLDDEIVCGKSTGKNYFFCSLHAPLVDDYGDAVGRAL